MVGQIQWQVADPPEGKRKALAWGGECLRAVWAWASLSCLRFCPWPTSVLMRGINCSTVPLTSVDSVLTCGTMWHNVAHPLDRPMAISLPFFRLGRALRHNAHSILSELSPDYAPQRSRAVASDHLFCNPWNLIKLISEVTSPVLRLPWTNDIFVAVVQATRIQASRLPSGATSKSSSFSTSNQCIRQHILCSWHSWHWLDIPYTICKNHIVEVINSQTISETNGVLTANT